MRAAPAGRLRAFRLTDIPLDVRVRAARQVARETSSRINTDVRPEDVLFARLRDFQASPDPVREAAESPSTRVYWIPSEAWERVMSR